MNKKQMQGIRTVCAAMLADAQKDGRAIDKSFIDAGFIGVQAGIDLLAATMGRDSYESLYQYRMSAAVKKKIDKRVERLQLVLDACRDVVNINEIASKVVAEKGIPAEFKFSLLRRYAPEFLDEIFLPHMHDYWHQVQKEAESLCKLFPPPSESLRNKSSSARRKEIFNTVASDVFSKLGFQVADTKRGLNSYIKPLGTHFAMVFKVDHVAFEKDYSEALVFTARYWPEIQIDYHLRIVAQDRRDDNELLGLGMALSVAERRVRSYGGSCSLEIAIRGYGFWYELAVKPLEKVLLEAQ